MINIKLRKAIIRDIPFMLELIAQLGYPTTEDALKRRFKKFITNKGAGVALAILERKIVGLIAWTKSYLFVSDKARFHTEGLIVDKTYRHFWIGKALMTFVENIARKNSPSILDLTSGLRRAPEGAHEFYKKLGYKNEGRMAKLYLRKEL